MTYLVWVFLLAVRTACGLTAQVAGSPSALAVHHDSKAPHAFLDPARAAKAANSMPVSHVAIAKAHTVARSNASRGLGFEAWYAAHTTGRGIWKWQNALTAYQRHFAPMAGTALKLVEIGVQSGGSIQMWQSVLGATCHVYGIDINAGVNQFQDGLTTITIGDQADVAMWTNFYQSVTMGPIDALVDDGGHEPHQMLVTLEQSFDHLTPGGVIAIEDIHGGGYVESFFVPAAKYLGMKASQGTLGSVHVYPYVLLATHAGNDARAPLTFGGPTTTVSSFEQMWPALAQHAGGHVILENAAWGPFLTEQGMANFFRVFGDLHGSAWWDAPTGCRTTTAAVCTVSATNNAMQNLITGIHVYPNRLVVEVAGAPVLIQAVRKGDFWLPYGL